MPYPDGSDLGAWLVQRGILTAIPADTSGLDTLINVATAHWERDTGWLPFLASAQSSERTFTPDNKTSIQFLNIGLFELVGVEYREAAKTETEDFWLEPTGKTPKTRIQWEFVPTGRETVVINGFWGYTDTLPADVEQAIYKIAAVEYMQNYANGAVGLAGIPKRIKQDDVEKEFGENDSLMKVLEREYHNTVMRYLAPWKVMA